MFSTSIFIQLSQPSQPIFNSLAHAFLPPFKPTSAHRYTIYQLADAEAPHATHTDDADDTTDPRAWRLFEIPQTLHLNAIKPLVFYVLESLGVPWAFLQAFPHILMSD